MNKICLGSLLSMIIVGMLVLSGCEKPGSPLPLRHTGFGFGLPAAESTSTPTLGLSFKQIEIPSGKTAVYIYRPVGAMFGADMKIPFDVKANGKVLTTLQQGGYYIYIAEPGNIEFSAFDTGFMAPTSVFSVTLDAKSGQAYYLKGAHGKGLGGRAHLELVSPEAGANEIVSCKIITQ